MSDRQPFDWINEESITFLRRGYLSEGEEPTPFMLIDKYDKPEDVIRESMKHRNAGKLVQITDNKGKQIFFKR